MSRPNDPDVGAVESALLFLSRERADLEWMLSRLFPPSIIEQLVSKGGKRKKGRSQAFPALVDAIIESEKMRLSIAQSILSVLPKGPVAPKALIQKHSEFIRVECLAASLREALTGSAKDWARVTKLLHRWKGILEEAPEPPEAIKEEPAPTATSPKTKGEGARKELEKLDARLAEARRENASLQNTLGKERERRKKREEDLVEMRTKLREERLRAAGNKRKFAEAKSPGEREDALIEDLEDLKKSERIAVKKLALIEDERDDLRSCLEDHEQFSLLEEEEIQSFRNRPLIAEEQDLAELLAQAAQQGKQFKVLVLGGGEKQFRHKEKLIEYAEVVGFHTDWRMAEYVSWHKHIKKLEQDMNLEFDAMVILHWNRTTFTRKCREICNKVGQKPCVTCHYEGFTNLRASLRECLGQLLRRKP